MAPFKLQNVSYETPSREALSLFCPTPWCAKLIADPTLTPIHTFSRQPKIPSTEDSLISSTLSTPATIRAWQSYYRGPSTTSTTGEIQSLLYLGSGLDGHPNVAHGGILSTLIDEAMAVLAYVHLPKGKHAYTVFIKVEFRRPLKTPGPLLLRSWMEERSGGNKMWLRANVEDGGGVCAEGEGLFVIVEEKMKSKL